MGKKRVMFLLIAVIMAGSTAALETAAFADITVSIDIKPGTFPNSINASSDGKIPVAILSSAGFNAPEAVDRSSLTFGRTGNEQSLASCDARATDVNKDRLPDLVCTFDTQRTGFMATDTVGILKGRTKEGQPIIGQDSVRIVPPVGTGDKTPPTVIATAPAYGASGVAITTMVTATFSEPMNCSTLTTATFLLRDASSAAVPGTVACNSSTATFTPAAVLSYSTLYTAMITTGAKDLAGNAMESNYAWSFTTVPPPTYTISGTVSLSGGGPLPGVLVTLTGAANAATTTAADGSYSFAGLLPEIYIITPSLTGYVFAPATVTITNANVTQDFLATPADTTPPTVLVTDPTSSAVGVPVTTAVLAVFSEPVDCATISTATFRLRDALNSLVTGTTSCSDATAVFTPLAPLAYSMTHRAVVTTGVKDLAGNAMTSSYVWYFTTAAPPDTTPPTVLVTDPTGSAVGVPVTTAVIAVFSEPVDCATVSTATFRLRDASSILVPGTVTCNSSTAIFTPAAPLAYGMTYRAVLTTGIKDLAGNAMTSSHVWYFTTIAPSPHSISGTVGLSGGGPLPGATVALTGTANAATITAPNGSYSFAGLLPGTYTITPSMTGYVFTPATVTIVNADVTQDFTAMSAVPSYSVSGTVSYPTGAKSGRIYVSLLYGSGGGEPGRGTSIETPGTFLIRGVQPGNYTVYAWLDTLGNGIQNVANPSGMSMGSFMVSGTDATGVNITMTDPVLPPPSVPGGLGATPMDGAAVVYWNTIGNPSGRGDGATAYRVSWSIDGGATFPNSVIVQNTNNGVFFHDGLVNGQVLYYCVSSFIEGAESSPSPAVGPILIGAPAPTGGVSVSGTITFTGNAAGHRLWIVIADDKSGAPTFVSAVRIADPVSPHGFTIPGVPPGSYALFTFVDMDDNGWFNTGDKMLNMNSFRTFPQVTVAGTDVTGLDVQLPEVNATAGVATKHDLRAYFDGFALSFAVGDQIKRAVMVTIMSGLNIPLPLDLDRNWGSHYTDALLGTMIPAVGDAYAFSVTYADGTSEMLMASVTGLIGPESMATPISPVGPGASTVPTLIWAPPLSPPPGGFTYSVGVQEAFGPWIWTYPNNGMPSTQTSVVYNVDGRASQPVLTPGATYDWWVQVKDSNANQGIKQATFTTSMVETYTISGMVMNNSGDISHNIRVGACLDASLTNCVYGTLLPPGVGGPYTIEVIPSGTYYVGTCVDANNDFNCVFGNAEPQAVYSGNPVVITNTNAMGIDMTIPSVVFYSISGTVTNASADQTHGIMIGACQDATFAVCNFGAMLPPGAGGPYVISGIPAGTYFVGTAVDSNGNGLYDPGIDPVVPYTANPVTITNSGLTGINMTIPGAVDTTPPSVVVQSPANGTAAAWISSPVTATFSEPVNCSSVNFSLRDAAFTVVSGTVTCGGRSATFQPAAPLAYSATYAATIAAGVMDLAGNAMTSDVLWSFTTSGSPVVGGDYWVTEYGVCPTVWPAGSPDQYQYTEDDWAQVRSGTLYNLGWRSRVTLTEPDANGDGTATFTEFWNHRHMAYQGLDPGGITPGSGAVMATLPYTIDPNNKFTMTVNGDIFHMAFSRDYGFFTGVHREGGNGCQDMLMGVKAATAPVTLSGLFSSVNYYNILAFRQGAGMPAPDPAAIMLGTYGQVIWVDQSVPSSRYNATDMLLVSDPTLAGASGHASLQISTPAGTGPQTTDQDGTLTVAASQGLWHAVSPDGRVRITAMGTNDSYSPSTDPSGNTTASHMLGSLLSLKQDPGVTFTAADVVGTYFLSARRDDIDFAFPGTIGTPPPNACANNLSDVSGSASCGTGVHPRWRMSWGNIMFNPDGTATANLTEFSDQQEETPLTATGTYVVRKECFGSNGTGGRLPWNDPVCAGGRIMNVLVVNSGTATIAKFFIGNGGDVLAFYDPTGFSSVAGIAGRSRWVGSAVRLK